MHSVPLEVIVLRTPALSSHACSEVYLSRLSTVQAYLLFSVWAILLYDQTLIWGSNPLQMGS